MVRTLAMSWAILTIASLTTGTPAAQALSSAALDPTAPVPTLCAQSTSADNLATPSTLQLQHGSTGPRGVPLRAPALNQPADVSDFRLLSSADASPLESSPASARGAVDGLSSQRHACSGTSGARGGSGESHGVDFVGATANAAGVPSISGRVVASVQGWLGSVAVDGRDRAVDLIKNLDNQIDNALSGVAAQVIGTFSTNIPADSDEAKLARELVAEAVSLIEQVFQCIGSIIC